MTSRFQRNRPYYPNHPSSELDSHHHHYPASIFTELEGDYNRIEDDLASQIIPVNGNSGMEPSKPAETTNAIPEEAEPEPEILADPINEDKQEEVADGVGEVEMVKRERPAPPSFLKYLGEELQIEEPIKHLQSPNQSFHYSKQHTGLKNLSFNVGAAVMPSAKMQFDQEQPESFGIVKINRPAQNALLHIEPHKIIGKKKSLRLDVPNPVALVASKSAENLTDQGFLDLKFYHNKLW